MTIFKHEDLVLDLTNAHKGKLYKNGYLMFMGDGYRAITMMMRNCKDYKPVFKEKSSKEPTIKSETQAIFTM